MIAFSQTLSKDSINYPISGVDVNGVQVVTITKNQQQKINRNLLSYKQCKGDKVKLGTYTELLEAQLKDYKNVVANQDTTKDKVGLMIANREAKIAELEKQVKLHIDNTDIAEHKYKATKRKLVGWKVGTFVTIGVVVVAAITIPIIILK